jgi:hypothetical protein
MANCCNWSTSAKGRTTSCMQKSTMNAVSNKETAYIMFFLSEGRILKKRHCWRFPKMEGKVSGCASPSSLNSSVVSKFYSWEWITTLRISTWESENRTNWLSYSWLLGNQVRGVSLWPISTMLGRSLPTSTERKSRECWSWWARRGRNRNRIFSFSVISVREGITSSRRPRKNRRDWRIMEKAAPLWKSLKKSTTMDSRTKWRSIYPFAKPNKNLGVRWSRRGMTGRARHRVWGTISCNRDCDKTSWVTSWVRPGVGRRKATNCDDINFCRRATYLSEMQ